MPKNTPSQTCHRLRTSEGYRASELVGESGTLTIAMGRARVLQPLCCDGLTELICSVLPSGKERGSRPAIFESAEAHRIKITYCREFPSHDARQECKSFCRDKGLPLDQLLCCTARQCAPSGATPVNAA